MTSKRVLIGVALAVLAASTGCRSFCDRNYPCQAPCASPVVAAPPPPPAAACVPCCPPGTAAAYVPPAPAAPAANWGAPRGDTCTCPRN
jgi:hypothetical protein